MPTEDFNKLVKPQILDQTLGEDIPARISEIKSDAIWPFKHVLDVSP